MNIFENSFDPSFRVYPNPTKGNITIELGAVFDNIHVTLSNPSGQVISDAYYTSSDILDIKIEGYKGIYFLNIQTMNGKQAIVKVIKN